MGEEEEYAEILSNVLVSQPCLSGAPAQPAQLAKGLYIGGQKNAENYPTLQRLGITHVLNCAGYKGQRSYHGSPYEGLGIEYMEFLADDTDQYDITQHFKDAFSYIDRARKSGGVVLVHCALGINRSGATCLGYLLLMGRMKLIKTAILIKSKRRVLLTNVGFQKRLVRLAQKNGLLDDLESPYVRRFLVSKPRHRSKSISHSTDQLFTPFETTDFSSPSYSSYSSHLAPSRLSPSYITPSYFTPSPFTLPHLQSSFFSPASHYDSPQPSLYGANRGFSRDYDSSFSRSSRLISFPSLCYF